MRLLLSSGEAKEPVHKTHHPSGRLAHEASLSRRAGFKHVALPLADHAHDFMVDNSGRETSFATCRQSMQQCRQLLHQPELILQKGADIAGLDPFGNKTIADRAGEDEGERALYDLLVLVHGIEDRPGCRIEAGNCA